MRHGRRFRSRQGPGPSVEPDLDGALDAMTAEELRSVLQLALRSRLRSARGTTFEQPSQ